MFSADLAISIERFKEFNEQRADHDTCLDDVNERKKLIVG
jgi:hypothetical protein